MRTARFALLLVGLAMVAVSCSSEITTGRDGLDLGDNPAQQSTPGIESRTANETPDSVVFNQLIESGFVQFEAECMANQVTALDLVSVPADDLLTAFEECGVAIERIIEVDSSQ